MSLNSSYKYYLCLPTHYPFYYYFSNTYTHTQEHNTHTTQISAKCDAIKTMGNNKAKCNGAAFYANSFLFYVYKAQPIYIVYMYQHLIYVFIVIFKGSLVFCFKKKKQKQM